MAHLIACESCDRVFDAAGMPVGERFRCHCGGVVEVHAPRDVHEQPVRRCASCGAPCEGRAKNCTYCGADLLKRGGPRDSNCPKCFAAVTGTSAFCHSCGHTLAATKVPVAPPVDAICPCCQENGLLHERLFAERVTGWECRRCTGLWMPMTVFKQLARQARRGDIPLSTAGEALAREAQQPDTGGGSFYRPCPMCGNLMNRRNYGRTSGVIIDSCQEHGIWFDANELAAVLDHIAEYGLERRRAPQVPKPSASPSRPMPIGDSRQQTGNPILEAVEEVLGFLFNSRW